ncbi:NADH-quinone oxidoreductase subunit K [Shigella flexneri]
MSGLLIRRNLLFILTSMEIMMNAFALAFVVAAKLLGSGRRSDDVHTGDRPRGSGGEYRPSLLLLLTVVTTPSTWTQ